MARARNIKPSFFKNELLVEMGAFDRLLFIGLWCLADREGRIEDRPKRIKMELFPCDAFDVDSGLQELARHGFITRYEAGGVRVISIVNFHKHQTPHGTEKDSELPDETGAMTVHERGSNGYVTGSKRKNNVKTEECNGDSLLDTCDPPVNTQGENTLNPDSLNPDSLNTPKPPAGAHKPAARTAVSLPAWLATTKAMGEKPIPDDDPVRAYAAEVGIPDDLMRLAWFEFRHRYSVPGAKRYKDWRAVFRKAVRGNWLHLWFRGDDGYRLTTAGHQAQAAMEAAA